MRFGILGPLQAVDDHGRQLALGARKQRAVLAILLLQRGKPISGERLADELWGERAPATAAKTVQVYISRLRKALGRDLLQTRGQGYVLLLAPDQLDVDGFERLAAEGREALAAGDPITAATRFREALALWRGAPLADFPYEGFAESEIARLEELRICTLEELIDAKLAIGRHVEVVGELEVLIAEYPYRERLRAQLMLALYRSERQAEALQSYQDARRRLVEEIGIEPGERLRTLERAILAQDPALAFVEESETVGQPMADPSQSAFVGRERELAELEGGLDDACAGRGRVFLLAGEPGVGKSRLGDELLAEARGRSALVLVGRCWEEGGAPAYWPWVQTLRACVHQCDREWLCARPRAEAAVLAELLPELYELLGDLPQLPHLDPTGERFRLYEAVASFLRDAAQTQPVVVALDDLHAADVPSLLLLEFVARVVAEMAVLVVCAYRDVEVVGDHPLKAALAELSRERAVRRVQLGGLSRSDVGRLMEATAEESPAASLVATIHERTAGNPLFVAETVRLLVDEAGSLGAAVDHGPLALAVPQGVSEVIEQRLRGLSQGCRRVLGVASVLGREFALGALERVCGEPEEAFIAALDEASAARVLAEVRGARGRLRFAHVLIRDVLYLQLGAARRLRLHRQVGEALEVLYAANPEPHLAELAHHFLEASSAGGARRAIDYARRAAERAVRLLAYEEAVRLYQVALQASQPEGSLDQRECCDLLLALGDAQARAGETPAAKDTFLTAAELARHAGHPEQLARAADGYGGRYVWDVGRDDPRLRPLLEEALRALGDDDDTLRVRLLARLAGGPLRAQRLRERVASYSEQAVELARRLGDPSLLAYALEARHAAVWAPDNVAERVAIANEMVHLSEATSDLERLFMGHTYRLWSQLESGDLAPLARELEVVDRLSMELGQPAQRWMVALVRALSALLVGSLETAERLIETAFAIGERTVPWNAAVTYQLQLFVLRWEQGRLDEVRETIESAVATYPGYPVWRCVLACLYAELGLAEEARKVLMQFAATDFGELPFDEEWLLGMSLLAEACASVGDGPQAAVIYQLLTPYAELSAVSAPEVSIGAVARVLGKLAATAGRWEQAEDHFENAIQLNARMGARPWLAHSRHDFARMLIARGRPEHRQRAQTLLGQALHDYRELAMRSWADDAAALQQSLAQAALS